MSLKARQLTGACRHIAAALPALTALQLESRSVGDGSVACVAELPQLRRLALQGATLGARGVAALAAAPALQVVDLRWCTALAAEQRAGLSAALRSRRGRLVVDGLAVAPLGIGESEMATRGVLDERWRYNRAQLLALREACRAGPDGVVLPPELTASGV